MTLAMGLACKEPCPKDFCITQVSTVVNAIHFNYVVEAKIYPEDPNTLFLTARGGGLTTLDVSEPASPVVLTHWDAPTTDSNDVEGQDRLGDLLVVVGRNGYVHLLDSSDPANISQIGFLDIPGFDGTFAALHVKIYSHHSGKQYAIVTSAKSDRLIAIDITNPENPTLANTIETGIHGLEGIFVANLVQEDEQRGYAFVGGYRSTRFSAIDLTNVTEENEGLAPMRVVKSLDVLYGGSGREASLPSTSRIPKTCENWIMSRPSRLPVQTGSRFRATTPSCRWSRKQVAVSAS
jgi:hypothetical protein